MKRIKQKSPILVCALMGVMVAGQALAVDLRYQAPGGDWTNTVAVDGFGWQAGGGGPDGLPGTADTARLNWGRPSGVTVTLSSVAPLIRRFQFGVDESGNLVVNAGGLLTTRESSYIGNNNTLCNASVTVNTGGEVYVTNVLFVGHGTVGSLTNDGGKVSCTSHLWAGSQATGVGTIVLTNGGSLNVGGNIGLGTINASTPSGGKCSLYVQEGGVLNLNQISAVNSIQPNSVLDISGSGLVMINGNASNTISAYVSAAKITAYGGTGTVGIDYNNTNVGKTTLWAIAPAAPPPTNVVWNPAGNPSTTGKWNESANWTGGVGPLSVTKVNFNVPGAIPCTITNLALADSVVMGDLGPGGTLTIDNGGSLTCGALNESSIGLNSNAVMVVENGGTAVFGTNLLIGNDLSAEGTLIMNGGNVSVAGQLALGYLGGKGTARINGGTLNVAVWDDFFSIGYSSVMDVTGTGKVVINGDRRSSTDYFIGTGVLTNSSGAGLVVDYNLINIGKTTIYPVGLYVPPAQVVWDPSLNLADTSGMWNVSSNWTGGIMPGNVTIVRFNVPDAIACTITNAAYARYVSMGEGGPGGTLIITNGGSLTCSGDNWTAVGRNNTALMVVENGGSVSLGEHLWIGLDTGSDGTLIMNGGTVSVGQMFGLGWNGGKGTANINGGTLNLSQLHPTDSIKGESRLNIAGPGTVLINGNHLTSISNYISSGKITANAGAGTLAYSYDSGANKTTIQVAPPQQSITGVAITGGNVSLTCQTTVGHIYHVESTSALSPTAWTRVAGTTTNATGTSVTFTFPAGPEQTFYRTTSP